MTFDDMAEMLTNSALQGPMRRQQAQVEFDTIKMAIAKLAVLGIKVELVHDEEPEEFHHFPKMLYHDDHAPVVVENAGDEELHLASGWRLTASAPAVAQAEDHV